MGRSLRRAGALAALSAVVLASGCAAMRAAEARQRYLDDRVRDYVYRMPLDRVWPFARQLVFESGYEVHAIEGARAGFSLETEWKQASDGQSRLLIIGAPEGDGCRVQVSRLDRKAADAGSGAQRDLKMELEIIRRVDPDEARAIEAEADRRGEAAR